MNEEVKKVCFLRVADTATKLNRICELAQKHFLRKEAVLIAVPSQEAATYIDQLLWRHPDDSFLPHAIVNEPSEELIVITTASVNFNKAKAVINLRPDIPANINDYLIVYDLLDLTHPAKEQLSRNRQKSYQQLKYVIEEK